MHKVAGALAARGRPLAEVARRARLVAAAVRTVGASMSACSIPGAAAAEPSSGQDGAESTKTEGRFDKCAVEFGLGIHGEPGAERMVRLPTADELARKMVDSLFAAQTSGAAAAASAASQSATAPLAVLVNGLGGISNLELSLFVHAALAALKEAGHSVRLLMAGSVCTSLDMRGVSLSVLPLDEGDSTSADGDSTEDLLLAPVSCPAWPGFVRCDNDVGRQVEVVAAPVETRSASGLAESSAQYLLDSALVVTALESAAATTAAGAAELGRLDALAGDGDAGTTLTALTRAAANAAAASCAASDSSLTRIGLRALLGVLGEAVAADAGGTSGVLYAIMLRAAEARARVLEADARPGSGDQMSVGTALAACFDAAVSAAQKHGGAAAGDRTMLDALIPAAEALATASAAQSSVSDWSSVAAAAERGAAATSEMVPRAGRASYVSAAACRGHRDAGAAGAALWIRAIADAVHSHGAEL